MRFLLDAQLPRRLARILSDIGHETAHTLDLPDGNRTADSRLCVVADAEARILVTKDKDFVDRFLLHGSPTRLLFVTTGNTGNRDLIDRFTVRLPEIEVAFQEGAFAELSRSGVRVHA